MRVSVGGHLTIDGSNSNDLLTGISSNTGGLNPGSGPAGDVIVHAGSIDIRTAGAISADTVGPGRGGNVSVTTGRLRIDDHLNPTPATGNGIVARSAQSASGAAGSVHVAVRGSATLVGGGEIATTSANTSGGALSLSASQITLDDGRISAEANGAGGNVTLRAPNLITLANASTVRSVSRSQNGGNITIDPLRFTLASGSTVSANAPKGTGGNVTINADALPGVIVGTNVTATGNANTTGRIATNPANTDVTTALARLPAELFSLDYRLQPQCGASGAFSSFLLTGRGGLSFDPATWDLESQPSD
jgi:hypothetical protein